jgi:hypothetical protein
MTKNKQNSEKTVVKLSGANGNAFNLLSLMKKGLLENGYELK